MKPTIEDVARAAGVSIKTVSRVANNESGVAEKTRAAVQQVIAQLGYTPNLAARTMRAGRSRAIGMLFPLMPNSFTSYVHLGALQCCGQHQFSLITTPCEVDASGGIKGLQHLKQVSRVDGVLLSAPFINYPEIYDWLHQQQLPYTSIARPVIHQPSSYAFAENESAAYRLAEHLIALGHRKIALVLGIENYRGSIERERGIRLACAEHGIEIPQSYVECGGFSFQGGLDAGSRLLNLDDPPTAICCCSDTMAIGVMHAAKARGVNIPEDLSITGFDNIDEAGYTFPGLTTAHQPVQDMASGAVGSLIRRLQNNMSGYEAVGFPCEIIIRGSTGSPS